MNTQTLVVFAAATSSLTYADKKGDLHGITPEGALFKGGAALLSFKDAALESAFNKALKGNYFAAADIVGCVFPAAYKQVTKFTEDNPARTKTNFTTLTGKVLAVKVKDGKEFSIKQAAVRSMLNSWLAATSTETKGEVVAEA